MIRAINQDLTVALAANTPAHISLGDQPWVAFTIVPSPFYVRFNDLNADRVLIDRPKKYVGCDTPIRDIYIDTDGVPGAGSVQIEYPAGGDIYFLGDNVAARSDDPILHIVAAYQHSSQLIQSNIAPGPMTEALTNSNTGNVTALSGSIPSIGDTGLWGLRHGLIPGATANSYNVFHQTTQQTKGAPSLKTLLSTLTPTAVRARLKTWEICDVVRSTVIGDGTVSFGFGGIHGITTGEPFGFYFIHDSGVGATWRARISLYAANVYTQMLDVDTGIAAADVHELAIRIGQIGGMPIVKYLIDGVVVATHIGPLPAFGTNPGSSPNYKLGGACLYTYRPLGNGVDSALLDWALGDGLMIRSYPAGVI